MRVVDATNGVADVSVKALCSRGHPNKPENSRCFICGEFMLARRGLLPRVSLLPPPPPPPVSQLPPPPPPPRRLHG